VNRPVIRDQRAAQFTGVILVCVGAYLLYDAYEARGRTRPFAMRLLPG
jgi:hypothetical protein